MQPDTMDYKGVIARCMKSRLLRVGLPFLTFMIGGSFGLREFADLRFRYPNVKTLDREELAALGHKMRKPEETTIEAQYQKVLELDIDNWENKRIPRPWEEEETTEK